MLLAADVGGTKTLIGLFRPGERRPAGVATRVYATTEFSNLLEIIRDFLHQNNNPHVDAFSAGVAGPVTGATARLTNVDMVVDAGVIGAALGHGRAILLNDLEAMGYAVSVLGPDELHPLQTSNDVPARGNAALVAAGTGLGESVLHDVDGRLVPAASEGGHADFAARTPRELELVEWLSKIHGRVEVERVLSGSGIANLFRFTHESALRAMPCEVIPATTPEADLPAAVTEAALGGTCPRCVEAVDMFVSAYGAEAGNLALRALAVRGVFIGGGIAPKILPAMTTGRFMKAFLDKAPMDDLVRRMPVHIILNQDAVLIGAAVHAASLLAGARE
jgi:glucokinase